MAFHEKTLKKLEYQKVLDDLAKFAGSGLAKDKIKNLYPSANSSEINTMLSETSEAKDVLRLYPDFAIGVIKDIRKAFKKIEIEKPLEPADFLALQDNIRTGRKIKSFFAGKDNEWKLIDEEVVKITPLKELDQEISKIITEEGMVSENASPYLKELGNSISNLQNKIKNSLNKTLSNSQIKKALQENLITIRGDRYVIPIKQEYRSQIKGLIHDQSSSGATLFIEPMEVVELNNNLKSLRSKYDHEIEKILKELTLTASIYADELQVNLNALIRLDYIFAKAMYSNSIEGVHPKTNNQGIVSIIEARHPLIPSGEVVPISFLIGGEYNTVVITGPNTGGKTVALKTIGLLSLMVQSGIHIPCEESSDICFFEGIYADIGDEQSIEQSLSTFSSHMANIVNITENIEKESLVLLDEIGAGTDPTEGAALAMAILNYFHSQGCRTVATTHYGQLKDYAYSTQGVQNASVEFDGETLSPTYRLLMGLPGKSNAFEISFRLRLPSVIVENAKEFMSSEELQVSEIIQKLEEDRRMSSRDREEAELSKKEIKELKDELHKQKINLKEKEKEILDKAVQEARNIIKEAQRESKEVIKTLNLHKEVQETQKRLKDMDEQLKVIHDNKSENNIPESLEPGDLVEVPKLKGNGYVVNADNEQGEVQVQIGAMKVTVDISELRVISTSQREIEDVNEANNRVLVHKTENISQELNLRGDTVDEAIAKIEKFIDDASLANLKTLTLIHGRGTGALRTGIRSYLRNNKNIINFRYGKPNEGGDGVTIIEIN